MNLKAPEGARGQSPGSYNISRYFLFFFDYFYYFDILHPPPPYRPPTPFDKKYKELYNCKGREFNSSKQIS